MAKFCRNKHVPVYITGKKELTIEDISHLLMEAEFFDRKYERNEDYFYAINLQPGGHGVEWDVNLRISAATLYRTGEKIPLTASDFQNFVVHRVVNVAEAAEILGCSRQNIDCLLHLAVVTVDNFCNLVCLGYFLVEGNDCRLLLSSDAFLF